MKITGPTKISIETQDMELVQHLHILASARAEVGVFGRMFLIQDVHWKTDSAGANGHASLTEVILAKQG